MAKGNNKGAQGAQGGTVQAQGPVLVVKPNVALRGARAAWYAVLVQHAGKPASAYLAACTASPPSLPQRGKGDGKAEPASGWLNWFVRQGIASYAPSTQATQAPQAPQA